MRERHGRKTDTEGSIGLAAFMKRKENKEVNGRRTFDTLVSAHSLGQVI